MLLVCLLLFVLYNANLRSITSGDTIPARLLPFSLLLHGSLYLDGLIDPYLVVSSRPASRNYFVKQIRGHYMSMYPILTPVLVTPLYVIPAWWLSRQSTDNFFSVLLLLANTMEKVSGSLLAALSAGVLLLALRRVASGVVSILVTLTYGVASTTWTISSQALWRQGTAELCFALLLWALLGDPGARRFGFWVGLSLAMAAANNPAYTIFAAVFFVYFIRHNRQGLWRFSAPLIVIGAVVFAYNVYFFGRVLGGYPGPTVRPYVNFPPGYFQGTMVGAVAGLLVSPSRGLVIYVPWAVFALWGAVRLWKEPTYAWGRYLLAATALVVLVDARYGNWWGGYCYGPRYLTDILPVLAFVLLPVWSRIQAGPVLRVAFALAVAGALWVQIVGAVCYPMGWWDEFPRSVDLHPGRLWNWSDTQIARTWKGGHAQPELFYRWWVYLSTRVAL
jgi:hypothetical protein